MTPLEIINDARFALTDTDPDSPRQSNEELLVYVNDALKECATLAPQLFYTTGDMECVAGQTEQGISFADAQALADIVRVKGGRAVPLGDMKAMSAFNPGWGQDAAGEAVNWFRHEGDPLRFYIYPPAPVGQVLEAKYVRNPLEFALNDTITDLPSAMLPILVNYVIYRAESKDDEHVLSARASAAYQAFLNMLKPA